MNSAFTDMLDDIYYVDIEVLRERLETVVKVLAALAESVDEHTSKRVNDKICASIDYYLGVSYE